MQATQTNGAFTFTTLNHLIETTKDGESGFEAAAKDCSDPSLKHVFMQYSRERGKFAVELQNFVKRHGEEPEQTGTLTAALHRGWLTLKSAFSKRDNLAILEECERGEDYAVQQYQDAFQTQQLGFAMSVVAEQRDRVLKAHEEIKSMRDKLRASQTTI